MIPPHFLRPNRSSALPQRVIYVDTETRPLPRAAGLTEWQLRVGVACYAQRAGMRQPAREEWVDFTDPRAFWRWVDRFVVDGRRVVLIAHNTGYDLQVLGGPAALAAAGWRATKVIVDDGRCIIRAERGGGSLLVLDFGNYYRAPLRRIGELLGLEKLQMPDQAADDAAWRVYCRRDVEVLRAAFERWLDLVRVHDFGHFAETLAKQAMNAYRHRFLSRMILVHKNPDVTRLERAAYFGGRCEALYVGELPPGDYYKLDVNSAFAAVMRGRAYPVALRWRVPAMTVRELTGYLAERPAIAEVRIVTDEPAYPTRHDGRVVYPVGNFWTTLATPELMHAATRGRIADVGPVALYDGAVLFTRWVDELYGLRRAAAAGGDELAAELLNKLLQGLYGRFGMRLTRWDHIGDEPDLPDDVEEVYDADEQAMHTYRRIAGRLEERLHDEEGRDSFAAIPAHVTSYARMVLWGYLAAAGVGHAFYTDTDALIVDAAGYAALADRIDPERLGMLKVEAHDTGGWIGGPKLYRFAGQAKHKGRRDSAVDVAGGKYEQEEFVTLTGAMRLHHIGGPLTRVVQKAYATGVDPARVDPSGRVHPLRLPAPAGASRPTATAVSDSGTARRS